MQFLRLCRRNRFFNELGWRAHILPILLAATIDSNIGVTKYAQASGGSNGTGRAMQRKMWQIYSVAIEELVENHIDSDDAVQLEAALRRILDAIRA